MLVLNMNKRSVKRKFVGTMLVVGCVHFAFSWLAFIKSSLIPPSLSTPMWRTFAEYLAFPLVYGSNWITIFDPFPFLIVLNSVLWGGVFAALVYMIRSWGKDKGGVSLK